MTEELESLERVIQKLEEGGFEYLLTGSMAMSFYSVLRMTRGLDILILLYEISIEDLIISKLNWTRTSLSEMQLNDIRELLKNEVGKKYINEWISKLNLNEIYKRI